MLRTSYKLILPHKFSSLCVYIFYFPSHIKIAFHDLLFHSTGVVEAYAHRIRSKEIKKAHHHQNLLKNYIAHRRNNALSIKWNYNWFLEQNCNCMRNVMYEMSECGSE